MTTREAAANLDAAVKELGVAVREALAPLLGRVLSTLSKR